jgi:hypothetical protein
LNKVAQKVVYFCNFHVTAQSKQKTYWAKIRSIWSPCPLQRITILIELKRFCKRLHVLMGGWGEKSFQACKKTFA